MADFCKLCSIETFGQDFNDLAGITKPEDQAKNLYCVVICEGCGVTQVDAEGKCVSLDCLKKHNKSCKYHHRLFAVTNLDGEDLCQECADAWVRGEGQAAHDDENNSPV